MGHLTPPSLTQELLFHALVHTKMILFNHSVIARINISTEYVNVVADNNSWHLFTMNPHTGERNFIFYLKFSNSGNFLLYQCTVRIASKAKQEKNRRNFYFTFPWFASSLSRSRTHSWYIFFASTIKLHLYLFFWNLNRFMYIFFNICICGNFCSCFW